MRVEISEFLSNETEIKIQSNNILHHIKRRIVFIPPYPEFHFRVVEAFKVDLDQEIAIPLVSSLPYTAAFRVRSVCVPLSGTRMNTKSVRLDRQPFQGTDKQHNGTSVELSLLLLTPR